MQLHLLNKYYDCMQYLPLIWMPILQHLDKVSCKWFIAMYSEGKSMSLSTIIEEAKSFHDEIKIPDKCTFSDGWVQSNNSYL